MAAPMEEIVCDIPGEEFRKMGPICWKNLVYKQVRICAATEYQYQGWIFTIDPVSQSIILAQCEDVSTDGQVPLVVVMGHSISSITILNENTNKHKALLDRLFKSGTQTKVFSADELSSKKEKLKEWLGLHRVPVEECGDEGNSLSISGVLVIEPPYEAENCLCKNEIILARVQALIRNMENAT